MWYHRCEYWMNMDECCIPGLVHWHRSLFWWSFAVLHDKTTLAWGKKIGNFNRQPFQSFVSGAELNTQRSCVLDYWETSKHHIFTQWHDAMRGWVWIDTFFDTFCLVHLVPLVTFPVGWKPGWCGALADASCRAAASRQEGPRADIQPVARLPTRWGIEVISDWTVGTVEPVKLLEGHPVLAKKRYFDVHTDGWAEEQVHFQERT